MQGAVGSSIFYAMPMKTRETVVHPTAIVMPGTELGVGIEVGPYCVLEPGVELGDDCKLFPHVHLLGRTRIGAGATIGSNSVIGGPPQDRGYGGESTIVQIGKNIQIHEHVTIHRATGEGSTVIGDDVMMMTSSHIGHNSTVENGVTMANCAAAAGHSFIGAGAFMSAYSAVHQYGKVGRLTLVGGACMLTRDAPPFSLVVGSYPARWRGPNAVGLKRAGFSSDQRSAIRQALFTLYQHPGGVLAAAQELQSSSQEAVAELARFVLDSPRGICAGPR
jgi:UDP-N-acetylglucosamine acyltransferase